MKTCSKCLISKSLKDFSFRKSGKPRSWCKDCSARNSREYYSKHKDGKLKEYFREYWRTHKEVIYKRTSTYQRKHKEKVRGWSKTYRDELRKKFLEMYGNQCSCCGESAFEFLTIEHKAGQKGMKRENTHKAYRKSIEEYRPDLYEVLCMNCNHSKGTRGYCPHQIKLP